MTIKLKKQPVLWVVFFNKLIRSSHSAYSFGYLQVS